MSPSVLVQREFVPLSSTPEDIALPAVEDEAVAQLGDSMIEKGRLYSRPAIQLLEPTLHSGTSKGPFELRLPAGTYVSTGRSTYPIPGIFYQFSEPIEFRSNAGNTMVRGGVFVPELEGGTPQIYWHATDSGIPLTDPNSALNFEEIKHLEYLRDSFHQELIYNGRAGSTVKLIYREFVENRIRPAFTQEVTYDLSQGKEIGFKGARLQVHEADNLSIRYTVLSHLQ